MDHNYSRKGFFEYIIVFILTFRARVHKDERKATKVIENIQAIANAYKLFSCWVETRCKETTMFER